MEEVYCLGSVLKFHKLPPEPPSLFLSLAAGALQVPLGYDDLCGPSHQGSLGVGKASDVLGNDGIQRPSHQGLVQGQTVLRRVSDFKEIPTGKSKAVFLPWVAAITALRSWGSETQSLFI